MSRSIAKYGIPAQALAVLTTIGGCNGADPLVGDWVCTSMSYAGETGPCPYGDTYDEDGVRFEHTTTFGLSLREDARGELSKRVELRIDGVVDDDGTYADDFAIEGERLGAGTWDLSIPAFYGLEMRCVGSATSASCQGTDAVDVSWSFDFAPSGPDVVF